VWRVDGDGRYSEHKLTGWFDPPTVIRSGYSAASFIAGPLVEAMRSGGVLVMNELNRLPEGVQNVLLPAMDERMISLPRLGHVRAEPEFRVIATENPAEFVATSHLSEAILDRFELVVLDYQSEEEEVAIVRARLKPQGLRPADAEQLAAAAVRIVRATREDIRIRRGASVRAALSIAEIAVALLDAGTTFSVALDEAARMALPTRIELERELDGQEFSEENTRLGLVTELAAAALSPSPSEKKRVYPAT
jgi:MoxR-like ATPase